MTRTLLEKLTLPFESVKTLYENSSEVRLYENQITKVLQIGKRISAIANDDAANLREAKLLQKIQHPNIVPVHDVAVVDGPDADKVIITIEMIMPYYPRGSVFDALLRGDRFTPGESVQLTREALVGLGELHESHRLLHRDIKSANIFIDQDDHVRVGDLGMCIPMDDDGTAEHFSDGQIYSAPESAISGRCSRATDIYGVGLLLFELLNGPFPYERYTKAEVVSRLSKGMRPIRDSDLTFEPFVPGRLRQVVTKAISRQPDRRFETTHAMLDALSAAPFIDWRVVESADRRRVWEGRAPRVDDREYRVVAEKRRDGTWRVSGLKRVHSWRQCVSPMDVESLEVHQARAIFDQLVKDATSR